MAPKVILLDIEGTTSSISFVHRVLFPLALSRLRNYLSEHKGDTELERELGRLWDRTQHGVVPTEGMAETLAPLLEKFIQDDVKDTTLKWVQGKIWKEAFEKQEVFGHVYSDVPQAFAAWKKRGLALYIYSSGSVEAQELMFRHSEAGNLALYLSGYFDTTTGHKREKASYEKIIAAVGEKANAILFLSDVKEELEAATAAGMQVCLLLREGVSSAGYEGAVAKDFSEVSLLFEL